jgi:hypothetical protein
MNSTATDARRLGRLFLTCEAFPLIFAAGLHCYAVLEDVIPEDALVVAVEYGPHRTLIFTVWSSRYPVVPEGADPPALVPLIRCLERIPRPGAN